MNLFRRKPWSLNPEIFSMPKKVTVYSAPYCPYCERTKQLLKSKNVAFVEIDVSREPEKREKVQNETGWTTVPMIFIGDEFIGGYDDLAQLEDSGKLDAKLS